jgi:site-specific recombinase XerD
MLFADAVKLHLQHLRAKRRSQKTLIWYAEQFAAFQNWRSGDALPTVEEMEMFLADSHDRYKPSTVNARFRALRALFLFLERRRKLSHADNPIHLLDAPSVPNVARRFVPLADLDRLLEVCGGPSWLDCRDRLVLRILFYSGLRVSELCDLTIGAVDQASETILVRRGKGEKSRLIPCPSETIGEFVRYLFLRPVHLDALILASDGYGGATGALTREGVRQMLIRRCAQAGIAPAYSPHAFRHGFAMWLLNAGARLTTVSTAMGHSDPAITHAIYAHTTVVTVRREYDEALARTRNA